MSFLPGTSPGRFLVMTVPGTRDVLTETRAMERSQRNAIEAARSCTGRMPGERPALRSNGIGGPSAGLMLALALVDRLDRVDQDLRVAGTGTITSTGEVGPVVSVAEKPAGAEAAGAELFLVPADQADEAGAVKELLVTGVRSLDEALRVLTGGRRSCGSGDQ